MAHYTTTIKTLMDNDFDFELDEYPIFDENYRNVLNQNILYHYYENEIGFETAALFRFYLKQKMNEIMPIYNELYKAQKNLIDNNLLFDNIRLTESLEGHDAKIDNATSSTSSNSNSTSTNSGTSNNKNLFQDTPQGQISSQTLDDASLYATNVTLDRNTTSNSIQDYSTSSGNSTNNLNSSSTNSYVKHLIGNTGGKFNIDLLNDIKNNLMNIDLMIIGDLNELFMQIF